MSLPAEKGERKKGISPITEDAQEKVILPRARGTEEVVEKHSPIVKIYFDNLLRPLAKCFQSVNAYLNIRRFSDGF